MTRRFARTLLILATAAVFWLSSAPMLPSAALASDTGTPAQSTLGTVDANGNQTTCASVAEAKGGVLLGYIVPCAARTIQDGAQRMSVQMITLLQPVINAFIFLAIVLYGVRVIQGGGPVHVEGILLVLRITLVLGCLQLLPGTFIPAIYGIMDNSQQVVEGAIANNADLTCPVNQYADSSTPQVWSRIDCLMGKLWGFTIGSGTDADGHKKPNMLLVSSVFGLLGGFFFGGTLGAILFLTCIGMLWSMFWVVLRTALTFLNAYLYAAVLLILAPLFAPLVLMRATTGTFDKWWRGILGSFLLPLLITSYAMFAMLLYDKMLFAPNALINNLFNNDLMKQVEQLPQPLCDLQRTGNPGQRAQDLGVDEKTLYGGIAPFMQNFLDPILSAAGNQCGGLTKPKLDFTQANLGNIANSTINGKSPRDIFTQMFYDTVELLILALLIAGGMNDVIGMARRLVDSAVSVTIDTRSALETKFAQMRYSAERTVYTRMGTPDQAGPKGTTAGAQFFSNLSKLPGELTGNVSNTVGKD